MRMSWRRNCTKIRLIAVAQKLSIEWYNYCFVSEIDKEKRRWQWRWKTTTPTTLATSWIWPTSDNEWVNNLRWILLIKSSLYTEYTMHTHIFVVLFHTFVVIFLFLFVSFNFLPEASSFELVFMAIHTWIDARYSPKIFHIVLWFQTIKNGNGIGCRVDAIYGTQRI